MTNQTIADVLAKFSAEDIASFVEDFEKKNKSTALANVILTGGELDGKKYEGKMRPVDERPENFRDVDSVREAFFDFASTVAEVLAMTPGDPAKTWQSAKADKWTVKIPTPSGLLDISLLDV